MEKSLPGQTKQSPLSPLKTTMFRAMWMATMASNIGSLVQSVGEKWQMTQLTPSPLMVSLVETGATLPILLFGLAAGAIADIVDRRKWMLVTQIFMMIVAGSLSLLTFLELITPNVLLVMAVLIGLGSSLSMPTFQAIVPELLPRRDLAAGVALNSAGYNISRAIGPALGGLVIGWVGAGWAFLLNAVSFLAVVVVIWKWRRPVPVQDLPAERFLGAMKVGFRYIRHSRPFQIILVRTIGYIWFSCVIFSLLPVLAIHTLKMGSEGFGLLMGCIGVGAVSVALLMPSLRRRLTANQILVGFTVLAAVVQVLIAWVPHRAFVAFCLFLSGMSWLATFSTINTAIQMSVPSWVKARAFGIYQMAWGGSIAFAAAFWGTVADFYGVLAAFALSGAGMLLVLLVIGRLRIHALEDEPDLRPHEGPPHSETGIPLDAGPVLVQVEFRIPKSAREVFLTAMQEVRRLRLRDGAMRWSLFEEPDLQDGELLTFMEIYLHSSMGEHLRQHARGTMADRRVVEKVFRMDVSGRPIARHLAAVEAEGLMATVQKTGIRIIHHRRC